jgi:hypothetical protein
MTTDSQRSTFAMMFAFLFVASECLHGQVILDGDFRDIADHFKGALEHSVDRVPGRDGAAFRFNGTDSIIQLPGKEVINPHAGTIEMWVRSPEFLQKPAPVRMLFYEYLNHGRYFLAELHTPSKSKSQITSIYRRREIDKKMGRYEDYRFNFFPEDQGWREEDWHFLTWTWGSSRLKFYVDGVLQNSTEIALPFVNPVNPLFFGGTPKTGNGFLGDMDDIVVTKEERTAEQILNDFKFGFKAAQADAPLDNQQQRLQAVYFHEPPQIDGGIADECWSSASLATPFLSLKTGEQTPKSTRAYIGYDDTNLYVAFRCDEPHMDQRVAGEPGGDPFFADCVEFFLAPFGSDVPSYYQIALDYTGKSLATAFIEGTGADRRFDKSWKPNLKYAVSRAEADFWAVEMAIPLVSLAREDQVPLVSDWRVSFSRSLSNPKLFTSWSRGSKNYHDLKQFGLLSKIGLGVAASRSAVVKDFQISQLNTLAPIACLRLISRLDEPLSIVLNLTAEDNQARRLGGFCERVSLSAGESRELSLPFTLDNRGPCHFRLDMVDENKQNILWSSGNRLVIVPEPVEISLESPHYRRTLFSHEELHQVQGIVHFNLPAHDIRFLAGELNLKGPDGKVIHTQKCAATAHHEFVIDFPQQAQFGRYTIEFDGVDGTGNKLKAMTEIHSLVSIPGTTTVDASGFLTVDGKRFFMLGAPDLHIAIERHWMSLEDSKRCGFNFTGVLLSDIEEFSRKYQEYGYKLMAYIDPSYKVVYDQDWARLRQIMQDSSIRHPALFSYQSGDEILGRVSKETMVTAYKIISEGDPFHPVSFYENHTEYVIDSFDAADFGEFDYYPIVSEAPLIGIYNKLREQNSSEGSKPVIYVPEIFTARKWDKAAVEPTSYEQVEACAFLGIVAKARGIQWWRVHYSERHMFEWMMRTASRIKPLIPILLTDDLNEEAKSLSPGICVLSKKFEGQHFVIAVNANSFAVQGVRIQLPRSWNAGLVHEQNCDQPIRLDSEGVLLDDFSGPYGVKIYRVDSES